MLPLLTVVLGAWLDFASCSFTFEVFQLFVTFFSALQITNYTFAVALILLVSKIDHTIYPIGIPFKSFFGFNYRGDNSIIIPYTWLQAPASSRLWKWLSPLAIYSATTKYRGGAKVCIVLGKWVFQTFIYGYIVTKYGCNSLKYIISQGDLYYFTFNIRLLVKFWMWSKM